MDIDVRSQYTHFFPSRVELGNGTIAKLGGVLKEQGCKKVLLVTDPGVVKVGLLGKVEGVLKESEIEWALFSEVRANPTEENVSNAVSAYRDNKCDALVGFGGGSPIDVAKAARVLCSHPGTFADYYAINGGTERITKNMPFMAAIPTTSGTGTEVSPASVITNTRDHIKLAFFSFNLFPSLAIVDPELTLTCPPAITASTGMDALVHNIEGFVGKANDPMGEAFCAWGIRYIADSLRDAVADGSNLVARTKMAYGSYLGGLGPDYNLLGVAHSLSHQLSALYDTAHGVGNAVMIPHAMRFNLANPVAKAKMRWIATLMGEDVGRMDDDGAAETAIQAVTRLGKDIGIPKGLAELGIKRENFELICQQAMKDVCTYTNPHPVEDPKQLMPILEWAY